MKLKIFAASILAPLGLAVPLFAASSVPKPTPLAGESSPPATLAQAQTDPSAPAQ